MESKTAPLVEIKTNSTPGEFTAVISAIGNVDRQGDRVLPGAFQKAIEGDPIPPVYWAHKHEIPPIGEGIDWREKGSTVEFDGRLFVKGEVVHQYADMVYAGMKSYEGRLPAIRQFSYTYGLPDGGSERVFENGKSIRNLIEIRPVAEVGPCFLGANADTGLVGAAKSLETAARLAARAEFDFFQLGEKSEWDAAYIEALPDSSFLYIAPDGHRDALGKTEPRESRHFAFKNANGEIDMPRLRDAIDLAPKAEGLDEDVRTRVRERAQRLLWAQEGKAHLLGSLFSSKAWDDIEGYAVRQLLGMLDHAVAYIQLEEDLDDVNEMRSVAATLLVLLQRDFAEADVGEYAKSTNAVLKIAVELYEKAAEVSSDVLITVTDEESARLLLFGPQH